ncbi:MAG: Gldg family protein [Holophagales bacterium]|nr:Gldg family protein [Holophagales bacterium]
MMSDGKTVSRINLAVAVLLGVGILGLVNWIGARHYRRFDWTSSGLYTLSEKSTQVLKALRQPVAVTVFMTEGSPLYAETQELLRRYQAATPLLKVETLNPERNPARAQAFLKETGVMQLSVVFRAGRRRRPSPSSSSPSSISSAPRWGASPPSRRSRESRSSRRPS